MKIIHRDPALHAQRVAAIKKAKGTAAARKHASETLKSFFSNPENRRKRSIAMKGVRYFCRNCGREGHRKHYCPELKNKDRRFRCRLCGEKGHNTRTCWKFRREISDTKNERQYRCGECGQYGHNRRTCSEMKEMQFLDDAYTDNNEALSSVGTARKPYHCRVCYQIGHNSRTCPRVLGPLPSLEAKESN